MERSELSKLGHDLYQNAARFADQVSDQVMSGGRSAVDRGYYAYQRLRANDAARLSDVRTLVQLGVGAAALIGVGYLVRRIARDRLAQRNRRRAIGRPGAQHGEPTYELLARLDSREAIQRHNEAVRREHERSERAL
jgi:hypothetical protein